MSIYIFKSKEEAQAKAKELNEIKGYKLFYPTFRGDDMAKIEKLPAGGWYIAKIEGHKIWKGEKVEPAYTDKTGYLC